MYMFRIILVTLLSLFSIQPAWAALKTQTVSYSYEGKTFKGYLAWDDSIQGKRPSILVVHEWWGLNDYAKSRAEQLAKLGYVAFAADMYGDGKVAVHPEEAKAMVAELRDNLPAWLGRANAALEVLQKQSMVDPEKVAAIGYCFGGATVLQLAYSGANLRAVVSFHGALPVPETTEKIKAHILILQGAQDSFVSKENIQQLKTMLDRGKVEYKFVSYPDTVHGFTVPGSEQYGIKGVAYNAKADQKSWQEMLALFHKLFKKSGGKN